MSVWAPGALRHKGGKRGHPLISHWPRAAAAPDIAVGSPPAACAGTADAVPSLLPRTAVPTLDGKKNVLREHWAKDEPILAFCIHSSVRRFCQEVIDLLHT